MGVITLCDGKYSVQHDNGLNFKALRYGEEWRNLTGDGLVLAMAQRIEELQDLADSLYGRLDNLIAAGAIPMPDALRLQALSESLASMAGELAPHITPE